VANFFAPRLNTNCTKRLTVSKHALARLIAGGVCESWNVQGTCLNESLSVQVDCSPQLSKNSQTHAMPYNGTADPSLCADRRYDQLCAVKHAMLNLSVMTVRNPARMIPGLDSACIDGRATLKDGTHYTAIGICSVQHVCISQSDYTDCYPRTRMQHDSPD